MVYLVTDPYRSAEGNIMEQIVVHIKDKSKIDLLVGLLTSLDFVDAVDTTTITTQEEETTQETSRNDSADFFSLAGLWSGRDITLETIRRQAWPRQA